MPMRQSYYQLADISEVVAMEKKTINQKIKDLSKYNRQRVEAYVSKLVFQEHLANEVKEIEKHLTLMDNSVGAKCSFCGRRVDQVKRMIAGPDGVYICDNCVTLCNEVLEESGHGRT